MDSTTLSFSYKLIRLLAIECGAISSLAISADHSTIAGGHISGHIFTWEITRPHRPFLHIPPFDRAMLASRTHDSHLSGSAILHVGFLGTRRTALVSANDGGMAFSHLATRGLGAVARTVKTTRVLGRYPVVGNTIERPRKPSTVLAFAPLPLGNVDQPTDTLGLTALLTPYLLVIVSTTPIAQTQHKTSRPKEVVPHSTLSGCLAWFPAVKLKNSANGSGAAVSNTKLAYSWSNILTVLELDVTATPENDKPPDIGFRPRSRWKGDEAIVAVQWLSRSVLCVLTISQKLHILEDISLRITDSFDLLPKHVFHQDIFSQQLRPVVEELKEEDTSMHGVVAAAFYMSFRAYKGRLFLLGFNDISIGTLSNWADRLLALMEEGDFLGAITLATSYYNGDSDKLTVGLPEDDSARHKLVQEKLLEMIVASLRYTFGRKKTTENETNRTSELEELTAAAFSACLSMDEVDFLFDTAYDYYQQASCEGVFLEVLSTHVMDEEISVVPPDILNDLVTHFVSQNRARELEDMICRLDTATLDIDRVTTLCKQHGLYDALTYVWTQAVRDFITPLVEMMSLIKLIESGNEGDVATSSPYFPSAMKVFTYLAYSFTGRIYPTSISIDDEQAMKAKKDLYRFVFSGRTLEWPPGSREMFTTSLETEREPTFPYLRLLLRFDTPSFMSMLNEAFEDSFLNGPEAQSSYHGARLPNGTSDTGLVPTRQTIVGVLQDVVSSEGFDPEDAIYLDMFIARNLPKYPQYIILTGSALHNVLVNLCNYPSEEVAEDCQLSVEYLLSIYHPSDTASLIPLFKKARFYRVLKSVYRSSKQYAQLLETYFEDPDGQAAVFDCIADCLRPSAGLNKKQIGEIHAVIIRHASRLVSIDAARAALTLRDHAPGLLSKVLDALEDDAQGQFVILRTLLEPYRQTGIPVGNDKMDLPATFQERYVQLMCRFDPSHVADYVNVLESGDLHLDRVLPDMEQGGVIDAVVVLLARDGLLRNAMDRLVAHLGTLETALVGLIKAAAESPDTAKTEEAVRDLLEAALKYTKLGIWLCRGQPSPLSNPQGNKTSTAQQVDVSETDLTENELLWLDLIDTVVNISQRAKKATSHLESVHPESTSVDINNITVTLRSAVHQTFTALLTFTATKSKAPQPSSQSRSISRDRKKSASSHPTFLRILRAFLTRASRASPSLSDLRAVLAEIFAAYTFEETILSMANEFLDRDLFAYVDEAHRIRQRGWRPRTQVCEGCKRRVWGPGAGSNIWEKWEQRKEEEDERRRRVRAERSEGLEGSVARGKSRAKGEQARRPVNDEAEDSEDGARKEDLGPLVVFACRHLFHRKCLEKALGPGADGLPREYHCPLDS